MGTLAPRQVAKLDSLLVKIWRWKGPPKRTVAIPSQSRCPETGLGARTSSLRVVMVAQTLLQ